MQKACPDINEENGYWKEILFFPKKLTYFSFPGFVFGFYFYYYLQSGTWEYYFGGSWTDQPGVFHTAFLSGYDPRTAGFFFLPELPRAAASILTLVVCGFVSFLFFLLLELALAKSLSQSDPETDGVHVRHATFAIAALAALVIFYSFAGAPTLRKIPPAPHFFLIFVVFVAAASFLRRFRRSNKAFAEESVARSIIKRWEWKDIPPPIDLHEVFLVHTIRRREGSIHSDQLIKIYGDAVRETLADGLITRENVQRLESLRTQLGIQEAEHLKLMATLAEEERAAILDPTRQISIEKRVQLETYQHALRHYLNHALGKNTAPDDIHLRLLREDYHVTKEEHQRALDDLLGGTAAISETLVNAILSIERASHTIEALQKEPSPAKEFLVALLERRRSRAVEGILRGLSYSLSKEDSSRISETLSSNNRNLRKSVIERLRINLPANTGRRLAEAYELAARESAQAALSDLLKSRAASSDPYVRAVALHVLYEQGDADQELIEQLCKDEHNLVKDFALDLKMRRREDEPISIVEKMIALRSVPIFSQLAPEGLTELAGFCKQIDFDPGAQLCKEGDSGNEVFALLKGEVNVLQMVGGTQKNIGRVQAGGFIGELAVLDPAPRSATVTAGSAGVRVLQLDGSAFREVLRQDPSVSLDVLHTLSQRLRGSQKTQ